MYNPHGSTATPSSQLPGSLRVLWSSLPGSKSLPSFSSQRSKLSCQLLIHRDLFFVSLFVFSPLPLLRKYWLITSGKLRPGSSTTLFTILQPPSSPLHTHSFNKSPSPLYPQTKSLLLPWQQQLRWLSGGPIFLFTVWKSGFLSRCQFPTSRLILAVGRIQSLAVVGLGIPLPGWLPGRGPFQLLDTDHLCATWSSPSPSQQEGLQSFSGGLEGHGNPSQLPKPRIWTSSVIPPSPSSLFNSISIYVRKASTEPHPTVTILVQAVIISPLIFCNSITTLLASLQSSHLSVSRMFLATIDLI